MPNESYYSTKLIKAVRGKGIHCYKTSDRYTSGVPDIYIAGGNWVETKKVPMTHGRSVHVPGYFAVSQKKFAHNHSRSGDHVFWYVIFYDFHTGAAPYSIIAPATFLLRYYKWDYTRIREWAGRPEDMFDPGQPRNINWELMNEYLGV